MKQHHNRVPTLPGKENAGHASRYLFIGSEENQDGYLGFGQLNEEFESVQMGRIANAGFTPGLSGSTTATSGPWTATYTSGGSGAQGADGYVLTTAGANTNKTVLAHIRRNVSTVLSKILCYKLLFQQVAIVTSNLLWGVTNSTTDPFTTAPTNGVYFTATNGAIVGNVNGAGTGVSSTGTLATMTAGTLIECDFKFFNTGVATTSWGFWWVAGVMTPFSAAQIALLITMTGNLVNTIGVQTTTSGAASLTIDAMRCEYDR